MSLARATFQQTSEKWFTFRDCSVCVSEYEPLGSPPKGVIVFLHGRLGTSALWGPIAEAFRSQYRCVFVDFPGHGRSYSLFGQTTLIEFAELVRLLLVEILGEASEEAAILVGHDIGGAVAQICAIRWPQQVSALVLINSACVSLDLIPIPISWPRWKFRKVCSQLLDASLNLSEDYRVLLRQFFDDRTTALQLLHSIEAIQNTWPTESQRDDWRRSLERIRKPVLLLWGARDELVPPERGFELIRSLPDAAFYLNESSGHWPFLEMPEWVIGKVREFVGRKATRALR